MKNMTKLIFTAILFALLFSISCVGDPAPSAPTQPPVKPAQTAQAVQPVAPAPVVEEIRGEISLDRNFYLVIDGSGSMNEQRNAGSFASKIDGAKWAAKEFISKSVPPDVNLGLYVFDRRGESERVPLGKNNRQQIISAIDDIRADGGTPLSVAIKKGTDALARQRNLQLGYGEFYIVVVTDGEATGEDLKIGVAHSLKNGIPIITIGFGITGNHSLAKESISYRTATNPAELLGALKETQAESTYLDSTVFGK